MKKILFLSFISLFLVLQTNAAAIAPDAVNLNVNAPLLISPVMTTTTADNLTTYQTTYYWAGENLDVQGRFLNDVIVAGNNIVIDGIVDGDVLAAGNFITVKGQVNGNIRVAGNYITIDAQVKKNVTAFGNNITITSASNIDKDATAFGNSVNINGQVKGEITKKTAADKQTTPVKKDDSLTKYTKISYWIWLMIKLFWLLIVGLILAALGKDWLTKTTDRMLCCPGNSLLYGLLGVLLTPVAIVVICVTIIGIPLGLIVLLLYIILLYISAIFVGTTIGKKILPHNTSLIWPMLLGTTIFYCVNTLPYLGGLITFLASCWAIGAIIHKKCNCKHE